MFSLAAKGDIDKFGGSIKKVWVFGIIISMSSIIVEGVRFEKYNEKIFKTRWKTVLKRVQWLALSWRL